VMVCQWYITFIFILSKIYGYTPSGLIYKRQVTF
jgi:hypothetical protein